MLYAGSDWLERQLQYEKGKPEMSPLGAEVADVLGQVFLGLYHLDGIVHRVDWTSKGYIEVCLQQELATWDGCELTALVVLCHDRCLRLSIRPASPTHMRLLFHPREREGNFSRRHPTMEDAVASVREVLGIGEVEHG